MGYKILGGGKTKCHIESAVCSICGETFIPAALHRYKNPATHERYCSWTCYRIAQKNNPKDFFKHKRTVKD